MRKDILSFVAWAAVIMLGTGSLAMLALSRGEAISSLWLVAAAGCVAATSYRFYSKWLATRVYMLQERRATPCCVREDGKDFVKTSSWIVFGHHFAAIAGPGPLVGPVLAAQFGYLPGALWILIGATLGGAVHDSVILFCSVRRNGKSLGRMVREEIGPAAGAIALLSILAILIILIAVLGLVVVRALAESPWGVFTIAMTIPISMLMGGVLRYTPLRLGLVSACGVVGLLLAVYAGQFIAGVPWAERFLNLDGKSLAWAVIVYGFAASALPVWLLLAPRDYLSTFMKIGTVAALALAIVLMAPPLHMPALTRFIDGSGPVFAGPVFPFCFITIACGAISGFHALIASGTTPKMLTRESGVRTIGYGAMIVEMLVAVMALIAACSMEPGQYFAINIKGEPAAVVQKVNAAGFAVTAEQMQELAADLGEKNMIGRTGGAPTFAVGMARMFSGVLGGKALALWYHFAIMFEALFILTTVDAGTRVGRFLVQDLLGHIAPALGHTGSLFSNLTASTLFVGAWGWFLYQGVIDPLGGINSLWPIFGIANQLLAVIALAFATTVLIKTGKTRYLWVTLLPLTWLLLFTMSAGWMKIFSADPRLGFLAAAAALSQQAAAGGTAAQLGEWHQLIVNNHINAVMAALFMGLVLLIVLACAREWFLLLTGRKIPLLHETPLQYTAPDADAG
jgi:carbon starvation protein